MIPGKQYKPEDILRLAWRYRWAILVPFVVISAGTVLGSRYIPNKYRSDTLILVVPQRVPESYVKSTVTTRIEDRLQSISQQILSRTRLERILQDFNLYAAERRTGIMEDIVDRMRKDIEVQIVKGDAFRVAFIGQEPRTVMKVTERLASLFIDESLRDREVLAEGTNQFLEAQLEDARRQLVEHEKKLEQFRRQHDGELPTQVSANTQVLRNAEMQLQISSDALNRDRDQKVIVERQIADTAALEAELASAASAGLPVAATGEINPGSARQQLEQARAQLAAIELRLKPEHPDVVRLRRVVRELEQKAEAEALARPVTTPQAQVAISPVERARRNRLQDLTSQRENLDRDIAARQREETRLKGIIGQYQNRLAAAPTRESELVELTRDYDTLQKTYTSLLTKQQDSKISANLERRQIGEQFRILDSARMPEKPFSPNRRVINSAGAVAGLLVGLALAALLEYRDTSLKNEIEAASVLLLPVLAAVPLIVTAAEQRVRRRWQVVSALGMAVLVLAMAGVAYLVIVRT